LIDTGFLPGFLFNFKSQFSMSDSPEEHLSSDHNVDKVMTEAVNGASDEKAETAGAIEGEEAGDDLFGAGDEDEEDDDEEEAIARPTRQRRKIE
jgi:hypothetical protein